MSFNRTKYDDCAYNLQLNRSTNPGDYRLYAPYAENCNQCFSYDGPIGSKSDVSVAKKNMDLSFSDMADVESDLSWRGQGKLEKCNNNVTPFKKTVNHKSICNSKLTSEDTRFTFPLNNYREMQLTPYMLEPYLPIDPQCNIQPFKELVGLNSRLSAKDSYIYPEQEYMDCGESLPKEISNQVNVQK